MAERAKKKREAFKEKARSHTILVSKHDEQPPCIDLDKKQFIREILKMFAYVDIYLKKKEWLALANLGMILAYLATVIK